jgi:hypothetical protein
VATDVSGAAGALALALELEVPAGAAWVELAAGAGCGEDDGGVELAEALSSPSEAAAFTGLTWDDVPGRTAWETDETAEPTAGSALSGLAVLEVGDDADEAGVVSAWAWREKSTRMARTPAASSAAWIARRAICRKTA